MYVEKTKVLISFGVTAKLICVFVFAYVKSWFSHDAAHINYQELYTLFILLGHILCIPCVFDLMCRETCYKHMF